MDPHKSRVYQGVRDMYSSTADLKDSETLERLVQHEASKGRRTGTACLVRLVRWVQHINISTLAFRLTY